MALWFAYSYLIAIGLKQLADLVKQNLLPKLRLKQFLQFFFLYLRFYCAYTIIQLFMGEFF